ncbi:DeoR/GlpR family DNA-binding transcription regulator [Rhodobacteraceae bacterium M385]|nr:DeoR/GlpR family DNA-binding transcription regulator [Rhodobacteraceae bacterium M385]
MTNHDSNLTLSERRTNILETVEQSGFATIETLAERFRVSAQTVRRDIIALANAGRLQRFHGGAGPVDQAEAARLDYSAKRNIARPEKQIVGRRAAKLIPDGATLYLDVGTTIEACAVELAKRPSFTVFTNSMPAAMKFDPAHHQVHLLGGRMAGRDGSLVGAEIVDRLRNVLLDYALIACSAIDQDDRVMDFDVDKIAIKQAALQSARHPFLLATRSKFNRTALAVVASVEDFDQVISEG